MVTFHIAMMTFLNAHYNCDQYRRHAFSHTNTKRLSTYWHKIDYDHKTYSCPLIVDTPPKTRSCPESMSKTEKSTVELGYNVMKGTEYFVSL
jgi:hypothetical protein